MRQVKAGRAFPVIDGIIVGTLRSLPQRLVFVPEASGLVFVAEAMFQGFVFVAEALGHCWCAAPLSSLLGRCLQTRMPAACRLHALSTMRRWADALRCRIRTCKTHVAYKTRHASLGAHVAYKTRDASLGARASMSQAPVASPPLPAA